MSRKMWILVTFLAFFLGISLGGGLATGSAEPSAATPTVTVTATRTTTQPALPASCARALTVMERMMTANSTIASAGEKQLDLAHAARQAIFMKDWKALDKVMYAQTELNNSLDKPSLEALGMYADLAAAMKECRDELG